MTIIRLDPAVVEGTGSQFISRRADLEGLVSQAKSLMNSLQGQFTGQRATRIFSEWDQMQPNLQNAIQSLQVAGDLLKRAAAEFSSVDSKAL